MYMNNDEYMRAIVGDININPIFNKKYQTSQSTFINTYNNTKPVNIPEPKLENINLYPESFLSINPIVINKCKSVEKQISKDLLMKIVNEIYTQINSNNSKIDGNILKDLIQILVLNQLLQK